MGYWVINKHLESHLLISEGHPWGICDPLSTFKTLHMKCLHHPQCLSTPALNFCPATQPGLVFTWLWLKDLLDWFWFRDLVDWFCSPTHLTSPFFSCSLGEKAAQCNQQWGKLAVLAENRSNTVPWSVQFWGFFLGFGMKTRLQRGRIMEKFTPINKLQLPSGVGDKRKFWMSGGSKRRFWTGIFLEGKGARSQIVLAQKQKFFYQLKHNLNIWGNCIFQLSSTLTLVNIEPCFISSQAWAWF